MDIIDVVADQERIHKDQVSAVVQLRFHLLLVIEKKLQEVWTNNPFARFKIHTNT
jgi:hypothetical protein